MLAGALENEGCQLPKAFTLVPTAFLREGDSHQSERSLLKAYAAQEALTKTCMLASVVDSSSKTTSVPRAPVAPVMKYIDKYLNIC